MNIPTPDKPGNHQSMLVNAIATEDDSETLKHHCLSFHLSEELYGVDILAVEEIRVWESPTMLPHSPNYIRGVMNLRGMIVPIMDLRVRFNIGTAEYTDTTVVIFLRSLQGGSSRLTGVVVDAVADVISFNDESLETPASLAACNVSNYVKGIVNVGSQVMSILDEVKLLALQEDESSHDE